VTTADGGKGLAVQVYQRPAGFDPGWRALLLMAQPGRPGGAIIPVEGRQWLVMLNGLAVLPITSADFIAQARGLRSPVLADTLQHAQPLTPVFSTPDTSNRFWHYHEIAKWPDRFIAARAVRFNPTLGFDLTMMTLSALTLRETLDEQRKRHPDGSLSGLGPRYQKRLARALAFPWRLVAAQDGPAVDNQTRWLQWYADQVLDAARHDPAIMEMMLGVAGLNIAPQQLFSPPMVRQIWQQVRHPRALNVESTPPASLEKRPTITQEMASIALGKD
jgi:hypothetical protein